MPVYEIMCLLFQGSNAATYSFIGSELSLIIKRPSKSSFMIRHLHKSRYQHIHGGKIVINLKLKYFIFDVFVALQLR